MKLEPSLLPNMKWGFKILKMTHGVVFGIVDKQLAEQNDYKNIDELQEFNWLSYSFPGNGYIYIYI